MTSVLNVSLAFDRDDVVRVGRLAETGRGIVVLEYASDFIASGLTIDPYAGPPAPGLVVPENPRDTDHMPGVIADSLPDAWGRLLVRRRLTELGRPDPPSGLEALSIVGRSGRGALVYEPEFAGEQSSVPAIDFDDLAAQAGLLLEGDDSAVIGQLEILGGSSGGARPKIHVALDDFGHARPSAGPNPPGFSDWIVKFPARVDEIAEAGIVEMAYAAAARRAGITVPRTRLIPSGGGKPPYYAIERFDRTPAGARIHLLSAAGALGIAWSRPNMTYEGLFRLTRIITRDERDVRETYRRMVFNVLAHNRDDHAKQHSFLMDRRGRWRTSPAYDLTFSRGPGGFHYLWINGKGNEIARDDLLAEARGQGIAERDANDIIDRVAEAVAALPALARDLGLTRRTMKTIASATTDVLQRL